MRKSKVPPSHTPSPHITRPTTPIEGLADFWFSDGNLVLVADGIHFKVHRGVLARQSEVFRDILSIPQPADVTLIDGCNVVELYDSPLDVMYLLRALYDGLYFKRTQKEDFHAFTAILRLSTKYFIESLRQLCMSRLQTDWPSTLSGWDMREREATDEKGRYNPRDHLPHPIVLIKFAKEMGLRHLIPSAMYDLCRYGPSKVVSGELTHVEEFEGQLVFNQVLLSTEDLYRVLIGREAAQRAVAQFILEELTEREISPDCHNKHREGGRVCQESFYFIMLNTLRSVGGIACGRDGDPLYTLTQAAEMLSREDFSDGVRLCSLNICAACRLDFVRCVDRARQEVWERIPGWFGMDGFDH
ncbi:hypothetical protein BD410DRAFT_735751 [Rickenella mellea]|uniref:BTB domain-containing protein n=1 Tax=Rickenella mellea TaxID=50990 RepID=A0A4R5XFV2_9AGAM|nr:hypothetical protein BD410DRAFT_735751 [Rickenella mellea]